MNEQAVQMIKKLRQKEKKSKSKKVRKFELSRSQINFEAKSPYELVNFIHFKSSPPILRNFSIDQIRKTEFGPDFEKIPCHSTNVERFVSLTSQSGQYAVGYKKRHQWILNQIHSSQTIPTNATKSDFKQLQIKLLEQ